MANVSAKLPKKDSGKCSMRTAMDVVKRVLWDDQIPQECITIGYLDRFEGILEKPFKAFSWEPLSSLDYFTFAVPEHRIQYFKYKDVVVWDKRFRLDRVFGSSRSTKTIRDIIERYKKYCETSADVPTIQFNKINEDISFHWDSESTEETLSSSKCEVKQSVIKGNHREGKQPSNFFICQRIESSSFTESALKIQSHICDIHPYYKDCCVVPRLFHITLSTTRLEDSSQVSI